MSNERTFNNYARLNSSSANQGRYHSTDKRMAYHDYSNKLMYQRYGNSHLISLPRRKTILVFGPHWPGIVVTVCIILFGTWLNLKSLAKHTDFTEFTVTAFKVFITFFCISTHILLFLTATTDPGIVFKTESSSATTDFNLEHVEYCEVCQVPQPDNMKIHHCADCNYCIEHMDHHCPWMVSVSS
jgi:hypothetical protein